MSLPLAVGSRSATSQRLDPPRPHPDETDDGIALEPVVLFQTAAMCACPHHEWFVRATISYYDLATPDGTVDRTMAEVRMKITPLCAPLKSTASIYDDYRETVCRVKMPPKIRSDGPQRQESEQSNPTSSDLSKRCRCLVHVSTDRRHVACILGAPNENCGSLLAIFQLRIPRQLPLPSAPVLDNIPLPSYLRTSQISSSDEPTEDSKPNESSADGQHNHVRSIPKSPVVATNPRTLPTSAPQATAMASYNHNGSSCLVVSCNDEFLRWIDYRSGQTLSTVSFERVAGVHQMDVVKTGGGIDGEVKGHLILCDSENVAHVFKWSAGNAAEQDQGDDDIARPNYELTLLRKVPHVVSSRFLMNHMFVTLYEPSEVLTDRGGVCSAQVWCCGEKRQSDRGVRPLSSFEPTCDQIEDLVILRPGEGSIEIEFSELAGHFGIDYDKRTGCLCLSTLYHASSGFSSHNYTFKRVVCIWNWRANVLGLVWTLPDLSGALIQSQLWFGKDRHLGRYFVHMEALGSTPVIMRKQTIPGGILSPRSCRMVTSLSEPSSMLMSYDSVAFPTSRKTSAAQNTQLQWAESNIPSDYISSYGPPQLADFGSIRGSSLAISSSRGICVLDVPAHKWRMFGSEAEERAFQVVSMKWWEGTKSRKSISKSEDLLVAITRHSGLYYLSCWSSKRLDLVHQLLRTAEPESNFAAGNSWGVLLPHNIAPSSVCLMAEPKSDGRRCVALVTAYDSDTEDVEYIALQLQTVSARTPASPGSYAEQQPYHVYAQIASKGTIRSLQRRSSSISSVFLAGASFRFALGGNVISGGDFEEEDDFVAVLGIVCTPGGLEAISVTRSGTSSRSIVFRCDSVSRYWLADLITCGCRLGEASPKPNAYIWAIESLDGKISCWSVPFYSGSQSSNCEWHSQSKKSKDGKSPHRIMDPTTKQDAIVGTFDHVLGTICIAGKSSDLMQRSPLSNNSELALGCVPRSHFGCILSSGQQKRRVHGSNDEDVGDFDGVDLGHDIYSPTNHSLTPPSFLPSLFVMFREAAKMRAESFSKDESKAGEIFDAISNSDRIAAIEDHVQYRLGSIPNSDTVMMALRLLILNTVDALSSSFKKLSKSQSDQSPADFVHQVHLFSEVVDAIRLFTTDLQLASLFLEVGRQLEPSGFMHLFPLPLSMGTYRDDTTPDNYGDSNDGAPINKYTARTVPDMIAMSLKKSLVTAASALSLLGSKRKSKQYCENMLRIAIDRIVSDISSSLNSCKYDSTSEERRIIGDLFRYGAKLDDAFIEAEVARYEPGHEKESDFKLDDKDDPGNAGASSYSTSDYDTSDDEGDDLEIARPGLMCGINQSSILTMVVPGVFGRSETTESSSNQLHADIHDNAALSDGNESSGVENGYVKPIHDADAHNVRGETEGVAMIVGRVLIRLLNSVDLPFQWRAIAIISRLVQPSTGSGGDDLSLAEMAGRVDINDLDAAIPASFRQDSPGEEAVVEFLITCMSRCSHETHPDEAKAIHDFSALLLRRLFRAQEFSLTYGVGVNGKEYHEAIAVRTGLTLLCLVSGFTSDQIGILGAAGDATKPPVLLDLYKKSLEAFSAKLT